MDARCYRNEVKYYISPQAEEILSRRLARVLKPDCHSQNDGYMVRSLYFDSYKDDALLDKLSGAARRDKFRLRCYNNTVSFLKLEKKVKVFQQGYKICTVLSQAEGEHILRGEVQFLRSHTDELAREFYARWQTRVFRPKVIVEYRRRAYVYTPGNVRVTLDTEIESSSRVQDFLSPRLTNASRSPTHCILEVKYDRFLPDLIRDLVQVEGAERSANSKYANARVGEVQPWNC